MFFQGGVSGYLNKNLIYLRAQVGGEGWFGSAVLGVKRLRKEPGRVKGSPLSRWLSDAWGWRVEDKRSSDERLNGRNRKWRVHPFYADYQLHEGEGLKIGGKLGWKAGEGGRKSKKSSGKKLTRLGKDGRKPAGFKKFLCKKPTVSPLKLSVSHGETKSFKARNFLKLVLACAVPDWDCNFDGST